MSSPKSAAGAPGDAAACRATSGPAQPIIPTGTIFAAALDHLNHKSTVALLEQLTRELNEHCERLETIRSSSDTGLLRAELLSLLALLRKTTEQHLDEVALVKQQLAELQHLSTKSQQAHEVHIISLISQELEQRLAAFIATAGEQLESRFDRHYERSLKPLSERMAEVLNDRTRHGRRTYMLFTLFALLIVLLAGVFFLSGLYYAGRRAAPVSCPPAPVTSARPPGAGAEARARAYADAYTRRTACRGLTWPASSKAAPTHAADAVRA